MNKAAWTAVLDKLPATVTIDEVARVCDVSYYCARHWMMKCGRWDPKRQRSKAGDMLRKKAFYQRFAKVDWAKSNVEIAAELGVSRERVRQVRNEFRKPKPPLESRGRKPEQIAA